MKIVLKQMFILFITMIPAMIPALMVMTLCDLINLPEGPVYIVSTNLYSILWLLLYRYSTNHSRKKKLNELEYERITPYRMDSLLFDRIRSFLYNSNIGNPMKGG